MSISFDGIPASRLVPWAYIEFSNVGSSPIGNQPFKILVVGQKLASGSHAALDPVRVTSADEAAEKFGKGSMMHRQFIALKNNNSVTESIAIALDDLGAGAAATGKIAMTAASAKAGTLNLYIAGQSVKIGVIADQTHDSIATAIAAATADDNLPVSAVVNGSNANEVDLTAKHKGEVTNDIDIQN